MKNKSFAKNAFFYMCKTLVQILFPIITLPYISRILGVEKIGQYNFATAYVSYFALIANLGIQTYAVRTGSEIRDNKKQLNAFANEIYTINVISTIVALLLLFLILLTSNILAQYIMLASILSITIPLTTIGTEWIFNIYEDFTYISIRSMIFQAASILLMILFVKKAEDVFIYAFITVMASAGANILNYKKASGYFEHRIIISSNLKKHLLPILILFFSTIASQIYLNADVTMLGILKGDYATGLYTAATKIYSLARNLMATIITIILPRFAFWNLNDKILNEPCAGKYSAPHSSPINLSPRRIIPADIGKTTLKKPLPTNFPIFRYFSLCKVYQASTSELYGKVEEVPQRETTPFHPYSPYAVAKQYGFWMVKEYRDAYGMFAVNGILFNHESERRGENFVTRKITLAASRIAEGLQDHLELGNMDSLRDWGYAKDYVECMWLIMQQDKPEDFVIATGVQHTVRDFTEKAFAANGITIRWEGTGIDEKGYDAATGKMLVCVNPQWFRPTDVDNLWGDPTKAKTVLGWNPQSTTYEQLVEIMAKHDRERAKREKALKAVL